MLDDKTFKNLEKLSMVSINKENRESTKRKLLKTIEFIEKKIDKLVFNESTLLNEKSSKTHLREDIVKIDSKVAKDILKNAPKEQDRYFIVPKVLR